MRLTRKKAIELCIEVWTWCMETGKYKWEWPKWKQLLGKGIATGCAHCWFCYYASQRSGKEKGCVFCPYYKKYGHCNKSGTYYRQWYGAQTPRTRKKYAKLFLGQILELRK